jgi:hypothetical protein
VFINETGSLSLRYAISVAPHRYGTPYTTEAVLWDEATASADDPRLAALGVGVGGVAGDPSGFLDANRRNRVGKRSYHAWLATDASRGNTRPFATAELRNSSPRDTTSALAVLLFPSAFFDLVFFVPLAEFAASCAGVGAAKPPGPGTPGLGMFPCNAPTFAAVLARFKDSYKSFGVAAVLSVTLPLRSVLLNSASHWLGTLPRSATTSSVASNAYATAGTPSYSSASLADAGDGQTAEFETGTA